MTYDMDYIQAGLEYGYPICCIKFFANKTNDIIKINKERISMLGNKYEFFTKLSHIPCEKCFRTLMRNKDDFELGEVKII